MFNFLIFIHFANQITLKPQRLAQRLKLIFNFSTIMGQMTMLHSGTTWGIKDEERMERLL